MAVLQNLPPKARGTIAVVVTVAVITGVVFGVLAIRNVIKLNKSGTSSGQKQEVNKAQGELDVLNKNDKTKQKLTKSQAEAIANIFDISIQGKGTDEQSIKDQFYKFQNDADFVAVQQAFGTRVIQSGIYFVPDETLTMIPALHNELSDWWINEINKILAQRNIKYRI
jgi:hypothetical protein